MAAALEASLALSEEELAREDVKAALALMDEAANALAKNTMSLKAAPTGDPLPSVPQVDWTVSKSKSASNLDKDFVSKITLSLPSAQQQLATDIVFVLDKSTSATVENQVLDMLSQLNNQINGTGALVKVGVVIFNKEANNVLELTQLSDSSLPTIEAAIKEEISSGTNTHAGLLAGKAMLDNDASVDASRKYLIFVSDGISYMYNAQPTATAWSFKADSWNNWAGPDNWNSKYGSNNPPAEGWNAWLGDIGAKVAAQGSTYEYAYGSTLGTSTPQDDTWQTHYAMSIDKALYLTYETYYSAVSAGYRCYAVSAGSNTDYSWGPSFMDFLANGAAVDFSAVKNEILYLVDSGSTVKDYMGYVEGDYDFDFVNDASSLSLKVGNETYQAQTIVENKYGFKPAGDGYAFTLEYIKGDGKAEEHFVWYINEAISNFAQVQLNYKVKLTNPKTIPGTYGEYDANGSLGKSGLFTNSSATLYPQDSSGVPGAAQVFAKPTVSYEVKGEPLPWPESPENISRSKTATNLDANFESTVTLGLPAAEQQLVSDVVFVLDKSTSAAVESQVMDMLTQLNTQIKDSSAAVKVGVVIFNKQANIELGLTELNDANLPTIENAIKTTIESGTNPHAGLLAGKAMLDADSSVDASRKYLVFVSDGISYMYNAQPTLTAWSFKADSWANWAGPDNWKSKYGSNEPPADWATWLADIKAKVEAQGTTYEYAYGDTATRSTPQDDNWNSAYATSVDKALYMSYLEYTNAVRTGYNCYAVNATTTGTDYIWGPAFMSYLAQDQTVSFDSIKNDILYLLSAGSTVEDYIGSGTDNKGNAYNMDFVNDISRLSLTVGGVELDKFKIEDNKYGFGAKDGSYRFVLEYFPDSAEGADNEHFVWHINESIKITQPVQLSYVVKLSNPQTTEGTYGEYDANGSQYKGALYTNNSATLYPVDSSGNEGASQDFPKPTVSYTVAPTLISVSVTKVWNDRNDNDGLRPDSIKVSLYADNVNTGESIVLNGENKWQGSFDGLPAADQGKAIEYTVYEEEVKGYTSTASITETDDGFAVTLTNTHAVETVSIPVQKVWKDNDNANGRRPSRITLYLYANGEYTGETLVLRSRYGWEGSFDNLPKYSNGQPITYTVREKSVYFYNGKVSVNPNGGFIVTNYYTTSPGTGDSSNIALWASVCGLCILGLGAVGFVIYKRRKKE